MTYQFVSIDENAGKSYLWGEFSQDKKKMFLFASYLLNTTAPENFYIIEKESGRACKLKSFAEKNGITKEDIKNA